MIFPLSESTRGNWPLLGAVLYLVFGAIWVIGTDVLLDLMPVDAGRIAAYQTGKGILFVLITASLFYLALRARRSSADAPLVESIDVAATRLGTGKMIFTVMAAGLILIAGAIVVLAYDIWSEREQTRASAERNTENLAQVIEAQTLHVFRTTGITLADINDALKLIDATGADRDRRIHTLLQQRLGSLPFVSAIFIVDKNGMRVHDSSALPANRVDLSDRLYFRSQRDDPGHALHISAPLVNRSAGERFIGISRAWTGDDGGFLGVIVAALEPERIAKLYHSIDIGNRGAVSLLLRDGTLLARVPYVESVIGTSFSDQSFLNDRLPRSEAGTFHAEGRVDALRRISSYRVVAGLPLVVVVGLSETEVLSDWLHRTKVDSFATLVFVLSVIFLVALLVAQLRQRDLLTENLGESEFRYRHLFESNPHPIWIYDLKTLKFLAVNQTAVENYGYTRADFDTMTIRDIRPGEDIPRLEQFIRQIDSERHDHSAWRHRKKDGTIIDVEIVSLPFKFGDKPARLVLASDVTDRVRTERALRDSEERLRTVTDNVPALIGYVDSELRYRYVNKVYEEWYGVPMANYIGRTMREVIGEEWYLRMRPQLEAVLAGHTVTTERRADRSIVERYARFTYAPHFGNDGKVIGFYVMAYDITERRKAEEAIHELNVELERRVLERTAQLEAANRELEAFSYSVSHDLRAPLRSIDGFSKALLEDYLPKLGDEGKDFLHRIRNASQRMGELIDDLLALSRVTRSEMARVPVDLSMIAGKITEELRRAEPQRMLEIAITSGMVANADPNLMRVLLENLLDNAWKFTSRRELAKIELGMAEKDGQKVYFVRDNGAGFNMAYADKLFGAFQRLHSAQEFAGTGIGLATVNRIVLRHGGRVWAEGEVDVGATVFFVLG